MSIPREPFFAPLVHARSPRACRRSARLHLHAIEQNFECRVVDLDVARSLGRRLRNLKYPAVQSFVKNAHAAAIEKENFERFASAAVEDKERSAASVVADLLSGDPR